MSETSLGLEFHAASPNIDLRTTQDGYQFEADPSSGLAARIGGLALGAFCLTFIAAGIFVWFLPDTAFDGDPFILKLIVSAACIGIFGPIFYYSFISKTRSFVEIDLRNARVHEVFLDGSGQETDRRSYDFRDIKEIILLKNDRETTRVATQSSVGYGQIYMRLSAMEGRTLITGDLSDLSPISRRLSGDINQMV